MEACLARRTAGAADCGAGGDAQTFLGLLAKLAVKELIGDDLIILGVSIAHTVRVVPGVVGKRGYQCC